MVINVGIGTYCLTSKAKNKYNYVRIIRIISYKRLKCSTIHYVLLFHYERAPNRNISQTIVQWHHRHMYCYWVLTIIWNNTAPVNNILYKPIMNHFHFHEDFYRHENRIIMVCRVVEKAGGGGVKTRNSIRGGRRVGEEVLTAPLGAVVVNCWCDYDTTSRWRAMAARGVPFKPILSWKLTAVFR